MTANFKSVGVALAAALGLGLAAPAMAQDSTTTTTTTTQSSNGTATSTTTTTTTTQVQEPVRSYGDYELYGRMGERLPARMTSVTDVPDPVAPKYPWTTPGTLSLYHYTDYTRWRPRIGSVNAARNIIAWHVHDTIEDEIARDDRTLGIDENRREWYPMAMSYPWTTPGSLSLYHYSDYTPWEVRIGNVNDIVAEREKRHDDRIQDEIARDDQILGINEWRQPRYPMAMQYPWTTPGTLSLYHYRDWTSWEPRIGNVNDAIARMEWDRDQKIYAEMQADEQVIGVTQPSDDNAP